MTTRIFTCVANVACIRCKGYLWSRGLHSFLETSIYFFFEISCWAYTTWSYYTMPMQLHAWKRWFM